VAAVHLESVDMLTYSLHCKHLGTSCNRLVSLKIIGYHRTPQMHHDDTLDGLHCLFCGFQTQP